MFPHLQTDQLDTRLKAVGLVGDLFTLPGSAITEAFQPIFSEFLKRLTDRVVVVRMCVLEHVKSCLLSDPFRAEAPQIISKCVEWFCKLLCDALLIFIWFECFQLPSVTDCWTMMRMSESKLLMSSVMWHVMP